MIHYFCEFGNTALIFSKVLVQTRLCTAVRLSVKVPNYHQGQGQGCPYWKEIISPWWYIFLWIWQRCINFFESSCADKVIMYRSPLISKSAKWPWRSRSKLFILKKRLLAHDDTSFLWIWQDCINFVQSYCPNKVMYRGALISKSAIWPWRSRSKSSILNGDH